MENSNQPAFPFTSTCDGINVGYAGMTKREHIAALAMQGLLANPELTARLDGDSSSYVGRIAVNMADALIVLLEK